jgi:hypothetical protein
LIQDHVTPDLLFVGTEFGVYVTVDEGEKWVRLKGGVPTIQVRDMDIQRVENDLVLGTFGRGFYVLDDYTPLRQITEQALEQDVIVFPVKDALRYIEKRSRIGSRGHAFYSADNPPFGAVFTYYLKESFASQLDERIEAEKEAREAEIDPRIPPFDELRAEDEELDPAVVLTIRDTAGEVIRRIEGCAKKGLHRVAWDLRYASSQPTDISPPKELAPWESEPVGPLALPGTYTMTLAKKIDGVLSDIAEPVQFDVVSLDLAVLPGAEPSEALAFEQRVARLQRAVGGAVKVAKDVDNRLAHLRRAMLDTPAATPEQLVEARRLQREIDDIQIELSGDPTKQERNVFTPPSISHRVNRIVRSQWTTTLGPTRTQRDNYGWAADAFAVALDRLRTVMTELQALEGELELAGAPWTPGRVPAWQPE